MPDKQYYSADEILEKALGTDAYFRIKGILQDLTPADVAPVVHGRWDGESDGFADGEPVIDVWYCSKCGHCLDEGIDDPYILPNFCPNCGAKMDLEAHHE